MRTLLGLVAVVLVLASAAGARADLPPPPGYVETCTVARQQQPSDVCVSCNTYYAEPQRCVEQYGGEHGYTQRCRTPGASVWDEVWCRPRTPEDGPAPPPEPAPAATPAATTTTQPTTQPATSSESCAIAPGARGASIAWLAGIGIALALVARRRG